jgi:hypothetical protein
MKTMKRCHKAESFFIEQSGDLAGLRHHVYVFDSRGISATATLSNTPDKRLATDEKSHVGSSNAQRMHGVNGAVLL